MLNYFIASESLERRIDTVEVTEEYGSRSTQTSEARNQADQSGHMEQGKQKMPSMVPGAIGGHADDENDDRKDVEQAERGRHCHEEVEDEHSFFVKDLRG